MNNQEKLETLKVWLAENGRKYVENIEFAGQKIDLFVKFPKVAVKVSESDSEFYKAIRYKASPFFIRESETPEFIIEKMGNCIKQSLGRIMKLVRERKEREVQKEAKRLAELERQVEEQRKKAEEAKKALHKRKRVRIPKAEKVTK